MRRLLKLAGAMLVVFVLTADVPVAAAPPCESVCTCSTKCSVRCVGPFLVYNCGEYGVCLGECRSSEAPIVARETTSADHDDALLARILSQPDCGSAAVATAD